MNGYLNTPICTRDNMENPSQFWDQQHEKDEVFWLTGTLPETIIDLHRLSEIPHTVMEIGVGQGQFIRELFKRKCEIYAVDVSQNALDKLGHLTDHSILTEDLVNVPEESIDLAVCHLVFQHCSDDMVLFIIKEVYRLLKPGGLFSFQIAGHQGLDKLDDFHKNGIDSGTHYFRDKDKISDILKESGVSKFEFINGLYFPSQGYVEWYIVHITK